MVNKSYLNDQNYYKSNYSKALEYIVPKYLIYDDIEKFGEEVNLKDQIINSHIDFCKNLSSIINIFVIPNTAYSSINSFNGISKYFIKQNNLSEINPGSFYNSILRRVDVEYSNFNSSGEFKDYLDTTLLPSIRLNYPSFYFTKGESFSTTHSYLIDNLSWLYFLNTPGPITNIYSQISNLIASKLYFGNSINLSDCIKLLNEFLWKNNYTNYYPSTFVSSTGIYTSGTQQLEKLKTWIDIIYSPLYADRSDYTVKNRFDIYRDNATKIKNKVPAGPFHKLLQVLSLAAFDIDNDTQRLESLYDIDECEDEFLPLLADLIGWKLFGNDANRWRLQLRNAVSVYKRTGTKKSIQFALNTVFPKDVFDIESKIKELWESYVPYLIYYSLATESPYFQSNETWTQDLANQLEVNQYSYSSIDENIKLATDRIIYEIYSISSLSSSFNFPDNLSSFNYRGRDYLIPPFEEYPYYVNVEINDEMVDTIIDRLVCFGVSLSFAQKVGQYIRSNTLNVDDIARSNSWLFFTSGYNEPPNISEIVSKVYEKKFEYVSLWSGKSSHFRLDLQAIDFDFSKKKEELDSGDAVEIAAQIVNEYAPAHAIPLLNLNLSAFDEQTIEEYLFNGAKLVIPELGVGTQNISNYQTSALYVSSYKRNTGVGNNMQRDTMSTLQSPLLKNSTTISNVPRNTLRRRSYEKVMPAEGYYDRTGFNMPVHLQYYYTVNENFFPLGYVPSSVSYVPIPDYKNIPAIYGECEGLNSSSTYNGVPVSSTFPVRGWNSFINFS